MKIKKQYSSLKVARCLLGLCKLWKKNLVHNGKGNSEYTCRFSGLLYFVRTSERSVGVLECYGV